MMRPVRGALAGLAGTALMSLAIAAEQQVRIVKRPAPAEVTEHLAERGNLRQALPEPAFQVSWLAAHVGFGAAAGMGYALVRPLLPRSAVLAGLIYGGAVWTASYAGILPALGLYAPPARESRLRTAVMILGHAIYGVTTAEVEQRLASRTQ